MNAPRAILGVFAAVLATAGAMPVSAARAGIAPERGVFRIVLDGRTVGSETFRIFREHGVWKAEGTIELRLPGQATERDHADLTLASDGAPVAYRWTGKSSKMRSIVVAFRGDAAEMTLSRPGAAPAVEAYRFPQGHIVVLDNNVYEDYAILAQLYDWRTRGTQKFSVLIPQDQTPGTIAVQAMGRRKIAGETLEWLRVESPDLEVDLYLDAAHRLMRIVVPGSHAEIVRDSAQVSRPAVH
jgi:hypothetical protein